MFTELKKHAYRTVITTANIETCLTCIQCVCLIKICEQTISGGTPSSVCVYGCAYMRVILHFTAYTSHRVKHATCPFLDALTCKRLIYFEQYMRPAVNTSQKAYLKKNCKQVHNSRCHKWGCLRLERNAIMTSNTSHTGRLFTTAQ